MNYFLAAFPILLVLGLMIFFHWSGQRAGAAGWVAGLMVAGLFFGLNGSVLWVSQLKSLFLSLFVLAILWPALLLYKVVDQTGGIQAIAHGLERWIGDGGLLPILLARAFSGLLEGLAGFGLPIAIVAPLLNGLGVPAAQGLSSGLGSLFPLISPLQNSAAMLLSIDPRILLAIQTTGGALDSMIVPAKIIVGCSTAGIPGEDGEALRTTIPYCLGICLLLGLLAWIMI